MSNQEITARRLDLAARGIDLLNSLAEIANSKSTLTGIALEVGQWLGRERLNRHQLQHCLARAQKLARANEAGELLFEQVRTGIVEKSVHPFWVQPSGALGRLLLNDPFLAWIVSTGSVLFQFHGESFVCNTLVEFIIRSQVAHLPDDLVWHPDRVLLEPVIKKIVSSVWYNVVNTGNAEIQLPGEFLNLCSKGHFLDEKVLARVLKMLCSKQRCNIMIQSTYIVTNLALWLTLHHQGRLRLVVGGKILYDRILGSENYDVEMRVTNVCDNSEPCGRPSILEYLRPSSEYRRPVDFSIYRSISGNYEKFFTGDFDTPGGRQSGPRARHPLYEIPRSYPKTGENRRDSIKMRVYCTAQRVLDWLLRLKITPIKKSRQLAFTASPFFISGDTGIFGDIVARLPRLLNRNEGSVMDHSIVFADPESSSDTDAGSCRASLSNAGEEANESAAWEYRPEHILQYYPILTDLLAAATKACQCVYCRNKPHQIEFALKAGCLRHGAFSDVMTLISHGIADSFGANDVSSTLDTSTDVYGVTKILALIRGQGLIVWEEFFAVAARVFLGCPPLPNSIDWESPGDTVRDSTPRATTVAVQYGSLAVIAPWLDIDQELRLQGCFSFTPVRGQLCVPVGAEDYLQAAQSEFVVFRTQHTEHYHASVGLFSQPGRHQQDAITLADDQDRLERDVFLSMTSDDVYTLLMRYSSLQTSRLVDPSRAIMKACQILPRLKCSHKVNEVTNFSGDEFLVGVHQFHELLQDWKLSAGITDSQTVRASAPPLSEMPEYVSEPSEQPDYMQTSTEAEMKQSMRQLRLEAERTAPRQTVIVSSVLGSYAKFNLAMALSVDNVTAINAQDACLRCAVEQAAKMGEENGFDNVSRDRWIINVARNPRSGDGHVFGKGSRQDGGHNKRIGL